MCNAGTVYGVSEAIVPYCHRFLPNNHKVHVIPNGVNTARFSPDVPPADSFSGLTIGFVGSLKPWHGLDVLLEAFWRLLSEFDSVQRNTRTDCRLLIVGDGPERDSINAKLDERIGLREKVKLVGAVRADQVPSWLNSMDIAVAPYPDLDDFYFSPLKIFEYMSAGRVVLASATGQIREVIQHGVSGWLYPPSDVDRLGASLMQLADNVSLRNELADQARKHAFRHSWSNVLDQILEASAESSANPVNQQGLRDEIEV
jgi:glycosyltransferase involved in cell wall biosynthesis